MIFLVETHNKHTVPSDFNVFFRRIYAGNTQSQEHFKWNISTSYDTICFLLDRFFFHSDSFSLSFFFDLANDDSSNEIKWKTNEIESTLILIFFFLLFLFRITGWGKDAQLLFVTELFKALKLPTN